jgi:aerobic C4-dicarboxylate transport protein
MLKFSKSLYGQVLIGLVAGVLVGHFFPQTADYLKPLGDVFIRAIKMVIGPIILFTVVVGIARVGDAKKIGRLGAKSLIYFELITAIVLAIGLIVGNLVRPGDGINADPATLDPSKVEQYAKAGTAHPSVIDFFVGLVPSNAAEAFVKGDIIHILVFAILLGFALASMGKRAEPLIRAFDDLGHALLRIVGFVMHLAPFAAFGAMAFTIGKYGIDTLGQLALLIACLYGAAIFFILAVLWPICRFAGGVSMWKLIRYFREELLITLGTASSEAVLPRMLEKLQVLGASKSVVGLVIPAGYSFNLAGSTLYMTLAPLFIAQALNIELSWQQQATMFGLLLFTSKGIAGVAGASMVVLASTLQATEVLPVAALALVLGIDRIQNEIRSVTNLIGNAVATIVMARSEKEFDMIRAERVLNGEIDVEPLLETGEEMPLPAKSGA